MIRVALIALVLAAGAKAKCSFQFSGKAVYISCKNVTTTEYVNQLYGSLIPLMYAESKEHVEELFIDIANSYIPVVDEWVYSPLSGRFSRINTVKIVNSSVEKFEVTPYFVTLNRLELVANHLDSFRFLSRKRFLKELDLSHNTFLDSNLLTNYLKISGSDIELLEVKNCNFTNFTVTYSIKSYDLSFNPDLSLLYIGVDYFTPFINLSHNNNDKLELVSHYRKCSVSLDLSYSKKKINPGIFNGNCTVKQLILSHNFLPYLDNATFNRKKIIKQVNYDHGYERTDLILRHTNLSNISSGVFNLSFLGTVDLSHNNLTHLQGPIFNKADIYNLVITGSNITAIDSEVFKNLEVDFLDLSHNNLTSLKGVFKFIKSLYNLNLSGNPIETLSEEDFVNCWSLTTLNLANVPLTTVHGYPLLNLKLLNTLTLTLNSRLDMGTLKNRDLTTLIITNSFLDRLKAGQFKHFNSLTSLTFTDSSVKVIDHLAFQGLFQLKHIQLTKELGNYEPNVFQTLYSLEILDLSKHQIKTLNIELRDLVKLKSLNLSSNHLESLNVDSFTNTKSLKSLSLAHNRISSIPVGTFRGLKQLTHLYLNNNQLQQLAPGLFSNLNSLILLDLSENILLRTKPHLVFGFSMPHLLELNLQGNQLGNEYTTGENLVIKNEFAALANHRSLKSININRNSWQCITLADVLMSLRSKNITYRPQIGDLLLTNIDGVSCTLV